jgi:hypothetical protein
VLVKELEVTGLKRREHFGEFGAQSAFIVFLAEHNARESDKHEQVEADPIHFVPPSLEKERRL